MIARGRNLDPARGFQAGRQALALARQATDIADHTDRLNARASVWLALAEVQLVAGKKAEAATSLASALECYELKGNIAAAARVRALAGDGTSSI